MNNKNFKIINKKFKIVVRDKKNLYKSDELIKNKKYYEVYNENYNNVKDKQIFKLMYSIFPKNLKYYKKCIPNKKYNKIFLFNKNNIKTHKNIKYLSYDNLDLYKTMDGFYTKKVENVFIKNNKNVPFWFSSVFYSIKAVSARAGGINSYKIKKNKKLKIIIVDCNNIKKFINIIKNINTTNINIKDKLQKKSYLLNLLRLSSCSEHGILDQFDIYNKFNNYDGELWITKTPLFKNNNLCDVPVMNNDYFGIIKSKGYHNYNFAYLLKYINEKFYNSYFDGYIIRYKYTPFFYDGITSEEMILFNFSDKIKRNIKNKYDWCNYKDKLPFKIDKKLKLRNMLSKYNINNFQLLKLYNLKYKSDNNKNIIKNINKKKLSVFILNCNKFISININDSVKKI